MPSAGDLFGHLHQLHLQLKEVQDQLSRGPRQIKSRQARIGEAEGELVQKEKELKESRGAADRKNLDLRSKEVHLNDLQAKLNMATSNREYDIIRGQIDADKAAKAVLEDEILEWLDRVDAIQREIVRMKEKIQEAQADARRFAQEFEQKAGGLHEREKELQGKIAEAEKGIPSDVIDPYRRLVEAYGADALASTENGVCHHCFVSLTSQNKVLLNSGKVLFCSSCGRLLYHLES